MIVAVIGGGSTYTPELVEGLAQWHKLGGPFEVVLQDIDAERVEVVAAFSRRMVQALDSALRIRVAATFEDAIDQARFVVLQIRVGGQQARHEDTRMGLDRNLIGQETTGVGGFAKALRTIPVVLAMARTIRNRNPKAWIINFTNPSGIVTEAICRFATTRCVGLCNVPKELQMEVAHRLKIEPERVRLDWVGLNHLGWARRILVDGTDVLPQILAMLETMFGPRNIPDLEYPPGFLRALGMMPSSYVRYYYASDEMLSALLAREKTRAQEVMEIEARLMQYYRDPAACTKPALLSERGGAWYSRVAVEVMEALTVERGREMIVNTLNLGAVEGLPSDASVEVPAHVSLDGVRALPVGEVEEAVIGLMRHVKAYERLAIEAAISKDPDKALLALLNNPLVPSVGKAVEVLQALKQRGLI